MGSIDGLVQQFQKCQTVMMREPISSLPDKQGIHGRTRTCVHRVWVDLSFGGSRVGAEWIVKSTDGLDVWNQSGQEAKGRAWKYIGVSATLTHGDKLWVVTDGVMDQDQKSRLWTVSGSER
ncbi:Hypothetical predicted protein [Xyrichtys novacula]|uniref:Uncharacterized protein n=1 Tax=Xyrichtys novacula TaxID=13765 RepID=A0AAV1HNH0_XYRNO|nr:Hypothetical predicted protein [Xyrichtys novacula]